MLMPLLLLQKPHQNSKTCEHVQCFEHRLASWKAGDIEILIKEGRTMQSKLPRNRPSIQNGEESMARLFAKRMFQGKTKAALGLVT